MATGTITQQFFRHENLHNGYKNLMYKKVLTSLNVENTVSLNWDKYSKIMPVFLKGSHGIVVICRAVAISYQGYSSSDSPLSSQ